MTQEIENTEEIWKDIPGYEGKYLVSSKGRVLSTYVKKDYLSLRDNGRGYLTTGLQGKNYKVHRLVALAFIPNPENKSQVNHIDGDKLNNNASNPEWATPQENVDHSLDIGLAKSVNSKEQRIINRIKINNRSSKEDYLKKVKRKIFQISKHGDELIKVWDSIGEAARENNIPKSGLKVTLCRNKPSYKGYRWQYYEIVDMSG